MTASRFCAFFARKDGLMNIVVDLLVCECTKHILTTSHRRCRGIGTSTAEVAGGVANGVALLAQ